MFSSVYYTLFNKILTFAKISKKGYFLRIKFSQINGKQLLEIFFRSGLLHGNHCSYYT